MRLALVIAALVALLSPASAQERLRLMLPNGTEVPYVVVLPDGFDPARTYGLLVTFPGGAQRLDQAANSIARFWGGEASRRGLIVAGIAAPSPSLSFYAGEEGIALVPAIIATLRALHPIADGRVHVAGHSNGGISAFRAAIRNPELFASLTVIAGWPSDPADFNRMERLAGLRIAMFVGVNDRPWLEAMEFTHQQLTAQGIAAAFTIVPDSGHALEAMADPNAAPLFAAIDP